MFQKKSCICQRVETPNQNTDYNERTTSFHGSYVRKWKSIQLHMTRMLSLDTVQNYLLLVKLNPIVHNILRMQLLSLLLKKKQCTSSNPESSKQWGVFTQVLNQENQATPLGHKMGKNWQEKDNEFQGKPHQDANFVPPSWCNRLEEHSKKKG